LREDVEIAETADFVEIAGTHLDAGIDFDFEVSVCIDQVPVELHIGSMD
jgi:hypothetical protein